MPFIGSGFSAPSGILMGQEFTEFLAFTAFLVLSDLDEREKLNLADEFPVRWSIRRQGWPRYPHAADVVGIQRWLRNHFDNVCESVGLHAHPHRKQSVLVSHVLSEAPKNLASMASVSIDTHIASILSRPMTPRILRSEHYDWNQEELASEVRQRLDRHQHELDFLRQSDTPTAEATILEYGVRSLHDWRATLQFFSAVDIDLERVTTSGSPIGRLVLREHSSAVIDSFNKHITEGKKGNIGHKMLAHLVRTLRIRTLLTTNFDSLIEDTLRDLHRPFKACPVSMRGGLPSSTTVRAQNTVVKLHGEMLETRADYSLDDAPSQHDRSAFLDYFLPPRSGVREHPADIDPLHHMLVIGYSASDMRCVRLIKHALDACDKLHVFWVCYSDADIDNVKRLFNLNAPNGGDYRTRITIFKTLRADLFLYELYQELALCLPCGGVAFQYTQRVPPESKVSRDRPITLSCMNAANSSDELSKRIVEVICEQPGEEEEILLKTDSDSLLQRIEAPSYRLSRPSNHSGPYAFTARGTSSPYLSNAVAFDTLTEGISVVRHAFWDLCEKHRKQCIWMELQDCMTPELAVDDTLRVIAIRLGRFQLDHSVFLPAESKESLKLIAGWITQSSSNKTSKKKGYKKKVEAAWKRLERHLSSLIEDHFQVDARDWVLFFYGRNVPGACSGWLEVPWGKDEYARFHVLLMLLRAVGFRIVYMPLSKARRLRYVRKSNVAESYRQRLIDANPGIDTRERKELIDLQRRNAQVPIESVDPTYGDDRYDTMESRFESILTGVAMDWLGFGEIDSPRPLTGKSAVGTLPPTERAKRQEFLYGASLFRQSRHTSAFFSDGAYPCPWRFNTQGVDNDAERASDVLRWVTYLRDQNVFHHKAGGYSWTYRDIRLAMQHFLQDHPRQREKRDAGDLESGESKTGYSASKMYPFADEDYLPVLSGYLGQTRSRCHLWIGDWYERAFFATAHSIPFVECLYHYLSAVRYAPYSLPWSFSNLDIDKLQETQEDRVAVRILRHRLGLLRAALYSIVKLLRIGRPWSPFWLHSPDGYPLYAKTIELRECFEYLNGSGFNHKKTSGQKVKNWFDEQFESIGKTIFSGKELSKFIEFEKAAKSAFSAVCGKSDPPDNKLINPCPATAFSSIIQIASCNTEQIPVKVVSEFANFLIDLFNSVVELAYELSSQDASLRVEAGRPGKSEPREYTSQGLRRSTPVSAEVERNDDAVEQLGHVFKDTKLEEDKQDDKVSHSICKLKEKLIDVYSRRNSIKDIPKSAKEIDIWESGYLAITGVDYPTIRRDLDQLLGDTILCIRRAKREEDVIEMLGKFPHRLKERHEEAFNSESEPNADNRSESAKKHWVWATILCNRSLSLIRHLPPDEESLSDDLRLRVEFLAYYGLALGYLGRWFEAHRRLNEADALLSMAGLSDARQLAAVVRLRRAEVYLRRKSKPGYPDISEPLDEHKTRFRRATLGDAWNCLEEAEGLLSGRSHASLWWGRLASLKLWAYSELEPDWANSSLVLRKQVQHAHEVRKLFKSSLLLWGKDSYRSIRAVSLFLGAYAALAKIRGDHFHENDLIDARFSLTNSKPKKEKLCGENDEVKRWKRPFTALYWKSAQCQLLDAELTLKMKMLDLSELGKDCDLSVEVEPLTAATEFIAMTPFKIPHGIRVRAIETVQDHDIVEITEGELHGMRVALARHDKNASSRPKKVQLKDSPQLPNSATVFLDLELEEDQVVSASFQHSDEEGQKEAIKIMCNDLHKALGELEGREYSIGIPTPERSENKTRLVFKLMPDVGSKIHFDWFKSDEVCSIKKKLNVCSFLKKLLESRGEDGKTIGVLQVTKRQATTH